MSDSEFEDELEYWSSQSNRQQQININHEEEEEEEQEEKGEEQLEVPRFCLTDNGEFLEADFEDSNDSLPEEIDIDGLKVLISKAEPIEEDSEEMKVFNAVKTGSGVYMVEEVNKAAEDYLTDVQMLHPEIILDVDAKENVGSGEEEAVKCGVVQRLQSSDGRFMLEVKKPTVNIDHDLANILNIPIQPKLSYTHKGFSMPRARQPKPEYKCTECDYVASNRKRLDEHNNVHSGAKPFTCGTCGKAFRQRGVLQLHMKRHLGQKSYKCEYCPFRGYSKTDVDRHVGMHTGLRAWVCEHCGKGFTSDLHLRTHKEAVHDRQREFRCKECDYWTYSRNALTGHVRGVHRPERVTHICPICGKKLKLKSSLFHHLRTHLPESLRKNLMETMYPANYPCEKCHKQFSDGKKLTQHKKQVHAEKKFTCNSCNKSFTLKSKLKRHEIIHTSQRPHRCPHCQYSCNLRNNLIKHVRNVHNKSEFGLDMQSLKYRERRCNGRHKPVPDRADMLPTWIEKGEMAMKEFLQRLAQNTGAQFTVKDLMAAQPQVEQEKKEKLLEMRSRIEAKLEEKIKKQEQRERRTIEKKYQRRRKLKVKKDVPRDGHGMKIKLYEHGAEAVTDDSEEDDSDDDVKGNIVSINVNQSGEHHLLALTTEGEHVVGEELVIEQDGTLQVGLLADLDLSKTKEEQLVISYPNEPSDAGVVVVVDGETRHHH